jgi:rhodanese-related sulfurtransferase
MSRFCHGSRHVPFTCNWPCCRFALVAIGVGACLLMLVSNPARAEPSSREDNKTTIEQKRPRARRPIPASYCGIQSLYQAARSLGKEVEFAELAKAEYVGSKKGSSVYELEKAGRDLGLIVQPMTRMTFGMLRQAECPVILHVKPSVEAEEYNHWVLFMGTEKGSAKIYDGERPVISLEFDDLATRWDGVGLLVSDSPMSATRIRLTALGPFLLYAGLAAFAVGVLSRLERAWNEGRTTVSWTRSVFGSIGQAASLVLIAVGAMAAYRAGSNGGYLSNSAAIAAIQDSNFGTFLPKVTTKELTRLVEAPNVAIVDARFPHDFEAGHLQGAINIPVNTSPEASKRAMARVPKEYRIVVHSHSNGCHFDEKVAKQLMALGYQNVVNFSGGWIEWEKQHPPLPRLVQNGKGKQG